MTSNTPKKYDDATASQLLGAHVGQEERYRAQRNVAAKELLMQFATLTARYGVDNRQIERGIRVITPRWERTILIDETRGRLVMDEGHRQVPVTLLFNPMTGMFEGYGYDDTVPPVPGQPRERLSALKVLVAQVFGDHPPEFP